ncbi:hypothetical protein [Mycobacteroides abscessus]|uniref:hypothetical protein n=1 Tax=Mycobacteroides abscessus TaxID=36809 RepID=UPI0012FFF004|nr:hypothetical protein [Mycobacteroides abscessus]
MGEISIVQNGVPRVWMMSIYYPSHEITREHNGWILCEQIFLTWDELYQYVQQNALVSSRNTHNTMQVLQALHRVEQRIIAAGCRQPGS